MANRKEEKKEEKSSAAQKALTIVGAVLCLILIPILIINITLIIKSYTNQDEVPKIGGICPLIVMSGSMEPEISSGDLIIVGQTEPGEIRKGDIIAFFDPDGNGSSVLTHRVTEVIEDNGKLSFRTKGDANNTEDRLAVAEDKLVGIYRTRIPGAGNIAMFMQSTPGLLICVVVPLVLLIGWDILRRRRYERLNKQDTDALLAELNELKAQKASLEKAKADTSERTEDAADEEKSSDK